MELPQSSPISFLIQTEVASSYLSDMLVFIYQECVLPHYSYFTNVGRWAADGREVLTFTLNDARGAWHINVEVAATNPVEVKLTPYGSLPPKILSRLREDLIIAVQMFEEKMRKTTLYFAWVPEKGVIPEKAENMRRKVISQIFTGSMMVFFIISIIIGYAVFLIMTYVFGLPLIYFPFVMVVASFIMILFSDKILGSTGDWSITASNPYVHILQYHIPPDQFENFREKNARDKLLQVKRAIQNKTLATGVLVDAQTAQEIFNEYGISIRPENIVTKTVNVYEMVKKVATSFKMSIPKIKLSNVIIPNAAATGPSPRFGLVIITTGLLVQLDDEEILSVVGHEMSHVKKRDPMALFVLTSAEYLLRIYIWSFIYSIVLFYIYMFFALGVVFFIAKFFEARADLDSAIMLGRPDLLAGALRKIGYRRIQLERLRSSRVAGLIGIESWINWNPHPPTSFRVDRLENLEEPEKIRHPFIKSMRDCIDGFLSELKGV
jgi:heat shock protein HtpX